MTSLQDTHWQYMCVNYECENRGRIWQGEKISPIDKKSGLQEFERLRSGLSNIACSRRVPRRGVKVVKSKSKVRVGRTRG